MLDNFRNGASVKVVYTYQGYEGGMLKTYEQELKGLLYKENPNKIMLVSINSFNSGVLYNWLPNVFYLRVSDIKDISSTRFKKEVSAVLNKQYKDIVEAKKLEQEIEKLKQQGVNLKKDIEKNSVELFNILSNSNLKDTNSWKERLKRDFSGEKFYRIYDKNSHIYVSFGDIVNKRGYSEVTLKCFITRDERLLSKEIEDRIIRGESVSDYDKKSYTPSMDRLLQVFKGKANISKPSSDYTIQDKGWVSFTLNFDMTFKVNLEEYDKWLKQITTYINKYFPKDSNRY